MIVETIPDIQTLTIEQKLLLITELWDSVTEEHIDIPVSDELLQELDARIAEYRNDPAQVATWEEAKTRIRDSRK